MEEFVQVNGKARIHVERLVELKLENQGDGLPQLCVRFYGEEAPIDMASLYGVRLGVVHPTSGQFPFP